MQRAGRQGRPADPPSGQVSARHINHREGGEMDRDQAADAARRAIDGTARHRGRVLVPISLIFAHVSTETKEANDIMN